MTKKSQGASEDPTEEVAIDEQTDDAIVDSVLEAAAEPDPPAAVDPDKVSLTYVGAADTFTYGSYTFKPGIPTLVSKEDAEGILTTPFERVVVTDVTAESQLEE